MEPVKLSGATALKIAFTADLHLTDSSTNPERFKVLADILGQCGAEDIQLLVIAGDLFDKTGLNYAEFEAVYTKNRPDKLKTIIIPGNHDQDLNPASISGEGLNIYDKPVIRPLNDSLLVLFLPYQANQTMGEAIAPYTSELRGKRWILIGHGDLTGGQKSPDPYESGVYMPLTGSDLAAYQPEVAFLGHIHLPQKKDRVHYPGSPCPLNITETGPRSFLIFDTKTGKISAKEINSTLEYYDLSFVMVPAKDDLDILASEVKSTIASWSHTKTRKDFIQVRVKIGGTSWSDRSQIIKTVNKAFSGYRFYQDQGPILKDLKHDIDPDKARIARKFKTWIEDLEWDTSENQPDKSQILEEALKTIYHVKS